MPYYEKMTAAEYPAAEYNVYVYHSGETEEPKESWAKTKTTSNLIRAVAEAEKLHASRKYPKVEIKMKTFKGNKIVDSVYRVYESHVRDLTALKEIAFLSALFLFSIACMGFYIIHAGH